MQCPSPISIADPKSDSKADRMTVPCGKCGACRSNRRADWSFRLKQELKAASTAFFITLTYENETLPISEDDLPTLRKRHWQLYIKKLRKALSELRDCKLRYYTVGEYGTKTSRPHYHTILFNLPVDCLHLARDKWEYGGVHIGTVEEASIHYITKYHVNKGDNKHEYLDETTGQVFEREPEFATMSRRPGIGANYIQTTKEWHRDAERTHVVNNGYKQRLPRYYKEKIFDPVSRKAISIRNQPQLDKDYEKEVNRLKRLKIENPESYILKSQYEQAKKVKRKANERDTF